MGGLDVRVIGLVVVLGLGRVFAAGATGCATPCPEGAFVSAEPNCATGYVDAVNGGCNGTPAAFEAIACGDTICGTAGTFVRAGDPIRDFDFYEFVVTTASIIEWRVRAEFAPQVGLHAGVPGSPADCPTGLLFAIPATTADAAVQPCNDAIARFWVRAGAYYAFAAPRLAIQQTPCSARYVASLLCDPAPLCPLTCAFGDVGEGEPGCGPGYIDVTNGGCQTTPTRFGALPFSLAGAAVCATTGTYLSPDGTALRREEDWFRFPNTQPGRFARVTAEAAFPIRVAVGELLGSPPTYSPCLFRTIAAVTALPCQLIDFVVRLDPGEHALGVMPIGFGGVACGLVHRLELREIARDCVASCPEGFANEEELPCRPDYVDRTNGGCDTTPARFGRLDCPQTRMCGVSGVYSIGQQGVRVGDTDWLEFNLPTARRVRTVLTSPGGLSARLVRLEGGCAAVQTIAPPGVVELPPCETIALDACLPAGRYALVLAARDADLPCGWPWTLDFTCTDCAATACLTGDSTGDGRIDFDDIGCFVAALIGPAAWQSCGTQLPAERYSCANDPNCDQVVDFGDIEPFVGCLTAGGCVPCE